MIPISLFELARLCGARLVGDAARLVTGPASLEDATPDEVTFLADRRYLPRLATTRAAAVIVPQDVAAPRADLALLHCADPQRAFSRVVEAFTPERPLPELGVHPSAVVDPTARVSPEARVGPLCLIGPGARVAEGAVLHGRVTLGACASVGAGTVLHPGVVLYPYVRLGERCIVHAGSVLGADGFGFEPGPAGWEKTPQGGSVIVEDDVEIGANVTIDCARFKATVIERNAKIDNLVHVAHNCRLGRSSMLLAQVGIAGSTVVGPGAIVAGQAGVAGHLEIGAGARVGGAAAVFRDVPPGEDWWGVPAVPKLEAIKRAKALERWGDLVRELRELRERVRALEEGR